LFNLLALQFEGKDEVIWHNHDEHIKARYLATDPSGFILAFRPYHILTRNAFLLCNFPRRRSSDGIIKLCHTRPG